MEQVWGGKLRIEFGMPIRHLSGNTKRPWDIQARSKGKGWDWGINLGFISL